jgi:hypothetical protein
MTSASDITAVEGRVDEVEGDIDDINSSIAVLDSDVYGQRTFEYLLNGVPVPVYLREDGTYYYILNDSEVTVAEADLVHEEGELKVYRTGGVEGSMDSINAELAAIGTRQNGFDARANGLAADIAANSLLARKNARIEGNALIITSDTVTGDVSDLLDYLQLNPGSVIIYSNGKDIATLAKTEEDAGFLKLNGTSLLIAQESKLSTIRMRSAGGVGNLAWVAGSNGHLSLKEVL